MVSELLVTGKIVHPGNSEEFVNSVGSQLRKVGLGAREALRAIDAWFLPPADVPKVDDE
jgi:hypothetical protein